MATVEIAILLAIQRPITTFVKGRNLGGYFTDIRYKESVLFCAPLLHLLGGYVIRDNVIELTQCIGRPKTKLSIEQLVVVDALDEAA
ncbi:hypothetical protein ACLOJK_013140 [Asimina triloba]